MGLALKQFTPEIVDRLQSVPEITLTGLQHSSNEAGQIPSGEYTARFSEFSYEKQGETRTTPSVAIVTEDGEENQLGALSARSMHLPIGTTVKAHIEIEPSGKTAKMQVNDLASEPESGLQNEQASLIENEIAAPQNLEPVSQATTADKPLHLQEVRHPVSHLAQPLNRDLPIAAESTGNYTTPSDNYSPSREELRQWCATAIASGNQPLTEQIIEKGQQLNALYTQETGSSDKPPLDYRNLSLVISDRERQDMQEAIATAKSTLATSAVSEPKRPAELSR